MAEGYQGDVLAKQLLESLTANLDFTIPNVNFDDPNYTIPSDLVKEWLKAIPKLTLNDLTTKTVDGSGAFDVMMTSVKKHLQDEWSSGRITGAEYVKAYIELTQAAMQTSLQYLLGKDQAYWNAIQAQIGAITANINSVTAKVQLAIAQAQAYTNKSQYALTTLQLATEDAKFAVTKEQHEQVRAQTLNTRFDGKEVAGSIGKQKELYTQQIDSYKKDAELKAGKVFSDAWSVQKSLDDGITPPPSFQEDQIEKVLQTIIKSNNLISGS